MDIIWYCVLVGLVWVAMGVYIGYNLTDNGHNAKEYNMRLTAWAFLWPFFFVVAFFIGVFVLMWYIIKGTYLILKDFLF